MNLGSNPSSNPREGSNQARFEPKKKQSPRAGGGLSVGEGRGWRGGEGEGGGTSLGSL